MTRPHHTHTKGNVSMSSSINKVFLLGYCGDSAEALRGGGIAFSLATSERWHNNQTNTDEERTDWHRIVMWGKRAEALASIIRKGLRVAVEGSIRSDSYEDDAGTKRRAVSIRAEDVVLLSPRDDEEPREPRAPRSERGRSRAQHDTRDNPAREGDR